MSKKRLDAVSALQNGLATQVYNMTQLKVFSPKRHMQEGETLTGGLTMTKDYEEFEFIAQTRVTYTRNPTVFHGAYINVHRDKFGTFVVTLRKNILTNRKDAMLVAEAIKNEYITAAKLLTL